MTQAMLWPTDEGVTKDAGNSTSNPTTSVGVSTNTVSAALGRRAVQNQGGFLTPYYLFDLLGRRHDEELDPVGSESNRSLLKYCFRKVWNGLAASPLTFGQAWTQWYKPLFESLGFEKLEKLDMPLETVRQGLVPISHAFYADDNQNEAPLVLVSLHPFGTDLDRARFSNPQNNPEYTVEPISRALEFVLDYNATNFALLSNGYEIRLYRKGGSIARQYLKVDFAALFDADDDKEWLAFWGLFRRAAFEPDNQADKPCLLDRVIVESQRHAAHIASDLRDNVVTAVEAMLQGVIDAPANRPLWSGQPYPDETQLRTLFEEAIYFLYRLLFVLYAESRDLLPVAEEIYYDTYSLEHLRDMAEKREIRPEDFDKTYYIKTIRTLFGMLRNGYPACNPVTLAPSDIKKPKIATAFTIPPYNGQLFDPARTALLDQCLIPDRAMREVVLALSLSQDKRARQRERYSYADLGVDQLGSIYEGLLVYEPSIAEETMVEAHVKNEIRLMTQEQAAENDLPYDPDSRKPAGSFLLRIWGGRRKGSGSYYTPQEITAFLVKDALAGLVEPIIEGCGQRNEKGKSIRQAEEILDLKVCDPAMGSGAFLVQACRYLAEAYGRALIAEGRDEDGRISETELASYKRRVAEKCLYGVDLNPLAVELAKVSLWLETLSQNRPLTFLDAHLRCGNALIGAPLRDHLGQFDPTRLSILPTEALGKATKDDSPDYKEKLKKLTTRNKELLKAFKYGQLSLFSGKEEQEALAEYERQRRKLEESDEDKSIEDAVALVYRKQDLFLEALAGETSQVRRLKQLCDLWCAVWFWPVEANVPAPHVGLYRDLAGIILTHTSHLAPMDADEYLQIAHEIAAHYRFFHWELEFPEVWCDVEGNIIPNSGFDIIVGNPPWDKIKPNQREFYSNYNATIWNYQGTARKKFISKLRQDEVIVSSWQRYAASLTSMSRILLEGGLYNHQTALVAGKKTGGDLDTFKFFIERAYQLLRVNGKVGIIAPHGIQATQSCTGLRRMLLDQCNLQVLCKLDNERLIFPDVFHGQKFDLLVFSKGGPTHKIEAAFLSWEKAEAIQNFRNNSRYLQIEAKIIRELDPEQYTLVELRSQDEANLVRRIYATFPRLGEHVDNTWNVSFTSEVHMTNNSYLFREGARLRLFGAKENPGRTWQTPPPSWFELHSGRYVEGERHVDSSGKIFFPGELVTKKIRYRVTGYLLKTEIDERDALPIVANEVYVPVYEGRMVHQFDHAAKAYVQGSGRSSEWRALDFSEKEIVPHFFIAQKDCPKSQPRAGFCGVTGQTNERSLLTAMIPAQSACGNSVPTMIVDSEDINVHLLWVGFTNSFVVDWLLRLRVSNNINFFVLEALAIPRLNPSSTEAKILVHKVLELSCVTSEFSQVWQQLSEMTWVETSGATDKYKRSLLRAEIDAKVADLYGLSESEFASILSTFPLLDRKQPALPGESKSFITRDLVLLHLFRLRGKIPPSNIVTFFMEQSVDIRRQTGLIVDLEERVKHAHNLGAIAYLASGLDTGNESENDETLDDEDSDDEEE